MQIDELARRFSERARERGEAYRRAGLVTIKQSSPTSIRAAAAGTEVYDVRIEVEGRTLVLSCSCPAFDNDGPCKHLWATALVAAERQMLAASAGQVKLGRPGRAPTAMVASQLIVGSSEDEDQEVVFEFHSASLSAAPRAPLPLRSRGEGDPPAPRSRRPDWETLFFPSGDGHSTRPSRPVSAPPAEILYVVEVDKTRLNGELTVSLRTRTARKKGGFAKDKAAAVPVQALEQLPDARDRRALPLLQAAATLTEAPVLDTIRTPTHYGYESRFTSEAADPDRDGRRDHAPARGDRPPVHPARAEGRAGAGGVRRQSAVGVRPHARLATARERRARSPGCLQRGAASLPLSAPLLVTNAGWVLFERSVGRLRHFDAFAMLASLRGSEKITLPAADEEAFLTRLYAQRTLPRLALPADLSLEERAGTAMPHLKIGPPAPRLVPWGAASDRPTAELSFHYDGLPIALGDPRKVIASVSERRLIRRDRDAETAAFAKFLEAGFQRAPAQPRGWPRCSSATTSPARGWPGRSGRWWTPGGGWRPRESCTGKPGTSLSRSRAASTGSICTERSTSTASPRRCPSCCGRCGEARPWSGPR